MANEILHKGIPYPIGTSEIQFKNPKNLLLSISESRAVTTIKKLAIKAKKL